MRGTEFGNLTCIERTTADGSVCNSDCSQLGPEAAVQEMSGAVPILERERVQSTEHRYRVKRSEIRASRPGPKEEELELEEEEEEEGGGE